VLNSLSRSFGSNSALNVEAARLLVAKQRLRNHSMKFGALEVAEKLS
jgi:hypothetical protein